MNKLIEGLKEQNNIKNTENGAIAYKSTLDKVYDLFAFGGAYRNRSEEDCILLFKKAYEENPELALKCLFYLRDITEGQGERRFFRICFKWFCKNYPRKANALLEYIPVYGRYDDMIYASRGTGVYENVLWLIRQQLAMDEVSPIPSLCAKWLPSPNASSKETKTIAGEIRKSFGITEKEYRKMLSNFRERIKVLEKLMSGNRWKEIDFEHIPSKAGLKYRKAFERRELIAEDYKKFATSAETKVNAKTLYPYEVVRRALNFKGGVFSTERAVVNKYWENLPNYLKGEKCKILCVCDTSGSMSWVENHGVKPIDVAISLSTYCAERIGEPFKNTFITFSRQPQFIEIEGIDFIDKVKRIYKRNICDNTNLESVFDLLLETVKNNNVPFEDIPDTLVIISDMEIDEATGNMWRLIDRHITTKTTMHRIKNKWKEANVPIPKLVYWNVNARNNTVLDSGDNITFVSGCSPIIFESVLTGVSGKDLMLQKLNSDRYKDIH